MPTANLSVPLRTSTAERELVITRVFDAPRELVFRAWTEPDRAVRWWGPHGFTTAHIVLETDTPGDRS